MADVVGSVANSSSTPFLEENESANEDLVPAAAEENPSENQEEEHHFQKKKRKKTSKAWAEFKEVQLPNGNLRYECIHCKQLMTSMQSGTTTHFLRHLGKCVRRSIVMKGQKQLSVITSLAKSESVSDVENFVYDSAKVREVFSHMILVHELPFNFAEYKVFNLLMKTACPDWFKISRASLRKDCFSTYELQKKMIRELLKGANRVSITTDLWTSNQKVQYMFVTCHFVDADLILQKRTLNFVDVPPPHNELAISDALQKCLDEWEIEKKIWTITVDNASYNDVAVNYLKDNLKYTNSLSLDGKFFHVRCCAHVLNILVQFGLSEIASVINNVRESVKHVSASVSRLHKFSEIVKSLNLPKKKLILDCGTRWNATYAMLVVALEYKDVFPRYKQREQSYRHLPSNEDWEKAKVVCSFLEEFEVVTNIISGTEYPTSNLFLLELWHIKKVLDDAMLDRDSCVMGMAIKMKEKFDKYWGESNLLISIAVVLDPRNKMKFLQYAYKALYSAIDAPIYMDNLRASLYELFEEYVKAYRAMINQRNSATSLLVETSKFVGVGVKRSRGRKEFDSMMRNDDTIHGEKSDLDVYLEEPVLLHNDEIDAPFDALDWWRQQTSKYRILSRMACDILSIPITTVASESSFSVGGRVIDPHRASLGTDIVQVLMCGVDWCRALYGMQGDKENVKKEEVTRFEYPL